MSVHVYILHDKEESKKGQKWIEGKNLGRKLGRITILNWKKLCSQPKCLEESETTQDGEEMGSEHLLSLIFSC